MTDSPWIETQRNHDMLEKTLADTRRHIGRVELRGTSGAQISINGKAVGILPISAPVHVAAGVVRIAATAAGRQGFDKSLTVAGGEDATLSIDLVPVVVPSALPPIGSPALQVQRSGEATGPAWRRWTGGALFVAWLGRSRRGHRMGRRGRQNDVQRSARRRLRAGLQHEDAGLGLHRGRCGCCGGRSHPVPLEGQRNVRRCRDRSRDDGRSRPILKVALVRS